MDINDFIDGDGVEIYNTTDQPLYFLSNYSNWPYNIKDWQIYPEVEEYLKDPVMYWQKYNRHHPLIGDNAFDPETGGYGDGYRYHANFSKLGLSSEYADKIAFAELIGVPVTGVINYNDVAQREKDLELFENLLFQDKKHLEYLKHLLFEADNKVIFLSRGVYNKLRINQIKLFGFTRDMLSLPFPHDDLEFRILFQHHSSYLVSAQMFSSIREDSYYPHYRRMIDSIVKDKPMEWEIILPGNSQTLKLKCEFNQLLSEIRKWYPETENLSGITLNPLKEFSPRLYQLPALTRFFENNEQNKGSINCLIHSILPLQKKKELMPHILDYYANIKHLLEPENQKLIKACLQESQDNIARNDEAIPKQESEIRNRFYRFSFHKLKGLESLADKSYYSAEKQVIEEIWNTILDNLEKRGRMDKVKFSFEYLPQDMKVKITVHDPGTSFHLEAYRKDRKSIITYAKMQRFGEMTIHSGRQMWSSEAPQDITETSQEQTGNLIMLCFVLPENN